ncbi:MAG: hypothetical protein ACREN8_00420 [Candidatus Dormibacteraceae bacterium]
MSKVSLRKLTLIFKAEWFLATLIPFVVSRILVWLGTEFGGRLLNQEQGPGLGTSISPVLNFFFHWDALYYFDIMRYGYGALPVGWPPSLYRAGFFPLYPYLGKILGGSDWALLVLSNFFFYGSLVLFYKLAKRNLDEERSSLSVWLIALFPWSIFFSYPYTESLFLFLTLASFIFMEKGNWFLAALFSGATAMTRFGGIILSLPLLSQFWQKPRRLIILVAAVSPVIGLVLVGLIEMHQMGDPIGFYHAEVA